MMRTVFTLTCLTAILFVGMLPGGVYALSEGQCEVFGRRGLLDPVTLRKECCKYASQRAALYCDDVGGSCSATGSMIDVQNEALGEQIRVSGTPFSLHYRNDSGWASNLRYGLAGWSLTVHNGYAPAYQILYTGDGRRRTVWVKPNELVGGELRIPSEDGTAVYVFDDKGRQLRTLNSLTGSVRYRFAYDEAGLSLTSIEDGNGNITRIERDGNNSPTAIIAPGGQRTTLVTNPKGFLASITNPAGETNHLSYSEDGLLTSLTDPKGQEHRFTYSRQGKLMKDENPAGGHWALTRTQTEKGFNVTQSSALGRTSTYGVEGLFTGQERRVNTGPSGAAIRVEKDNKGNDKVIYPDGTVSTTEFQPDPRWGALVPFLKGFSLSTPAGRKLSVSAERNASLDKPDDPLSLKSMTESLTINGRRFTSSFDASKKELVQTSPTGRQIIAVFDNHGRLVKGEIPGLLPVNFVYDDKGRISSLRQGTEDESRLIRLSYDAEGRLAAATDPLNRASRMEYDRAGRVTKQIFADGREILYAYDPNANIKSITPPGRPAHNLEFTPVNLLQSYLPPRVGSELNRTSYSYNLDKQLTRITRPDGKNVEIDYDKAGRVSSVTIPQGKVSYLFDLKTDQLKTVTAADGGTLSYAYDGFLPTSTDWKGAIQGNVSRAHDNDLRISSITINGKQTVENRYDPDGLLLQAGALTLERHPKTGLVTGTKLANVATTQEYNGFGEIKRLTAAFKGQQIFAVEYERDSAGRIVKKAETAEGQVRTFLYVYDLVGRLTEVVRDGASAARYEYDGNDNRVAYRGPLGDSRGSYDAQDRLVSYGSVTYHYTANGELAGKGDGGKTTAFDYDALGNLRGASLPGGPKIEYVIDGANRRIGKKLNGDLVQGFLYEDHLKPIAELDARNNVVSTFVYGTKVNVPEYLEKSEGIYRIVTDHLGGARLVINVETGTIAQRMDYDEFGNVLQDTSPGFQPFGFAGGLYDSHTKLTRFGARDYDASSGRWTAKDPAGLARGENPYHYVGNDPLNLTDSRGFEGSLPADYDPDDWAWERSWKYWKPRICGKAKEKAKEKAEGLCIVPTAVGCLKADGRIHGGGDIASVEVEGQEVFGVSADYDAGAAPGSDPRGPIVDVNYKMEVRTPIGKVGVKGGKGVAINKENVQDNLRGFGSKTQTGRAVLEE